MGELQRKAGYRRKQLISPMGQRKGVVSKRGFPCFLILGVGVRVDLARRCGEGLCAKDLLTSSLDGVFGVLHTSTDFSYTRLGGGEQQKGMKV